MSAIELDENGEMVRDRQGFTRIVDVAQIVQDVLWSVQLRMGEIPTATQLGIAWLQLLAVDVQPSILSQKVQDFILSRAGVETCSAEAVLDGTTRVATVTYQAFVSVANLRSRVVLNGTVSVLL